MNVFTLLNPADHKILRILGLYESLNPLQLWYELAEPGNRLERLSRNQILGRLEYLRSRGLVQKVYGMAGSDERRYRLAAEEAKR